MDNKYCVRYERHDGYYGCVETTAASPAQAQQRAEDYLNANVILYKSIDEVYEVNDNGKRG